MASTASSTYKPHRKAAAPFTKPWGEGMTEAVSGPVGRTEAAEARSGPIPRVVPGIYWVAGIFVGATVSYLVLRALFDALDVGPTPLMSIGTMLIGAAIATAFALAGYRPLDRVANPTTRATLLLVLSLPCRHRPDRRAR